ncbi:MAG: hypothetical protein RLZZ127_3041 [Planctomycetota bacterium]|jgi:Arc/MetJ family transcription regulator
MLIARLVFMCIFSHMATNLALDDDLITAAQQAGGHRTKRDAVTAALREYVQRHRQQEIADLFGSLDVDPRFDPKAARRNRA